MIQGMLDKHTLFDILGDTMEEILRRELNTDEKTLQDFLQYGRLLLETNAVTNLTAIREEKDVARLHFLDSVQLLPMADFAGKRVADVGTGPGFPGLPLKLMQRDMELTLLDSNGKKVDFLKKVCAAVAPDVNCVWGRVEEMPELLGSFDIVVSRAVAELDVLAELCLPLVKVGGRFIAMKGPDCGAEAEKADFAIRTLGGRIREIRRYTVPDTDICHAAVLVEKIKKTPEQYPRRYAQIKKKPLRG